MLNEEQLKRMAIELWTALDCIQDDLDCITGECEYSGDCTQYCAVAVKLITSTFVELLKESKDEEK